MATHTTDTVDQCVRAIDRGQLTVEDVLRKALRSTRRGFDTWCKRALKGSSPVTRRVQVWRAASVPDGAAEAAVKAVRSKLSRRQGVLSIHWGVRRERGRPCADDAVIVHCVQKTRLTDVAKRRRFPKWTTVRFQGTSYKVPVDVQAIEPVGTAQAITAVRAAAHRRVWMDRVGDTHTGTLGAVVQDSLGNTRAVLSGHVARIKTRQVFVETSPNQAVAVGTVDNVVRDTDSDVAWTTPLVKDSVDAVITRNIANARDPERSDLRTSVTVLVPRDFRGLASFVDEIGVTVSMDFGDRAETMHGLTTLSPQVTIPGDSGAPVVDFNGALIGFVLGSIGNRTVIVPARSSLNDLES